MMRELMRAVDQDGNGMIDLQEFLALCQETWREQSRQ
jgi:Ca2+-binding EF-hand superfamily protein